MVKLRLKRMGQKFNAFYRIVAADSRAPRDGRFIEEIGYYNPHSKQLFVNNELKDKWLGEGAVASDTVKGLFRKYAAAKTNEQGVATLEVKVKAKKVAAPVVEEAVAEEAAATEAPVEETTEAVEAPVEAKAEETTEAATETTEENK